MSWNLLKAARLRFHSNIYMNVIFDRATLGSAVIARSQVE